MRYTRDIGFGHTCVGTLWWVVLSPRCTLSAGGENLVSTTEFLKIINLMSVHRAKVTRQVDLDKFPVFSCALCAWTAHRLQSCLLCLLCGYLFSRASLLLGTKS